MSEYLTIDQAVEYVKNLGIKCSKVRMLRMARDRELPFFKDGRSYYIRHSAIKSHYDRLENRLQDAE